MNYEFRTLQSKDIFPMLKIISKLGINQFKESFSPNNVKKVIDANGKVKKDELDSIVGINIVFDIAQIILTNINKCQNDIYNFLASVSNLERDEIEKMSPAEFLQMIIDLLQKEEFKDFFGVVSKLIK